MRDPETPPADAAALLATIPAEVLEHDCGCGSAWRWARAGETVVDLGCGSGKTCFLLARAVGPSGRVIGVDASGAMIALARRHQPTVARAVGWSNVRFFEARIEELELDVGADLVVLDCVWSFVPARGRAGILAEGARLLRPEGRLLVSDVLGEHLEALPEALAAAGLERIEVVERSEDVRRVIDGLPRFATTVRADRSR